MNDTGSTASGTGARGTGAYFLAVFGITWLLQLPAVLAHEGLIAVPLEALMAPAGLGGAFGPLLAAVLVTRLDGSGVAALFRPIKRWRVSPLWYAIALGLSSVFSAVGAAVYLGLGGEAEVRFFYPPTDAQRIAAMVFFSFGEEIGWRGLAYPRLRDRHGPLAASLVVGVAWALWHVPMFVLVETPPIAYGIAFVQLIAGSVVFAWIYERSGGSLLLMILAHAGAHLCNPNQAIPGTVVPLALQTAGYVVVAVLVVILDRTTFARRGSGTPPPRAMLAR